MHPFSLLLARRLARVALTIVATLAAPGGAAPVFTPLFTAPAPAHAAAPAEAPTESRAETPAEQGSVEVQLRSGEAALLDGGALRLSFVQVDEDGRCPKDVMCVWMGRAVVRLHVVLDGADRGDVLVTLFPGPRNPSMGEPDAAVDRYTVALADLQPYPSAGQPTAPDQYVATIRVRRA